MANRHIRRPAEAKVEPAKPAQPAQPEKVELSETTRRELETGAKTLREKYSNVDRG